MKKYRTKIVEIEAVELTFANWSEICDFAPVGQGRTKGVWLDKHGRLTEDAGEMIGMEIETLEGVMLAREGDFIIKGLRGEFYPCKPDVFHMKYEEVEAGLTPTTKITHPRHDPTNPRCPANKGTYPGGELQDCLCHSRPRDAVGQRDGLWYFCDETWANEYGPYDTEIIARTALASYCKDHL